MSFGPSAQTKQAFTGLNANAGTASAAAPGLLNMGGQNVESGANFFNTLLNGNAANTTALLQPDINRIRGGTQEQLQAISTLMPRGGGRSGSLFSASYAPQAQISNLFNTARTGAASALPQIGLGQLGSGANLLSGANNAYGKLGDLGQTQQQITAKLWQQLGSGIVGLATLPFGGGAATGGLLGMIPGG